MDIHSFCARFDPPPAPPVWEVTGGGRQFQVWPRTGFFLVRASRHAPLVPALIFRGCPWVEPDPREGGLPEGGPAPEDWCRPTERPRPLRAMHDGIEVFRGSAYGEAISGVQRIWEFGRSISADQYQTWSQKLARANDEIREPSAPFDIPTLF